MNFEEAMQHVISGGKVIRGKRKNSEDFFKIYLSSDKKITDINPKDIEGAKTKVIPCFIDENNLPKPIFQTLVRRYSVFSFFYEFNAEDYYANDWEIYTGETK